MYVAVLAFGGVLVVVNAMHVAVTLQRCYGDCVRLLLWPQLRACSAVIVVMCHAHVLLCHRITYVALLLWQA